MSLGFSFSRGSECERGGAVYDLRVQRGRADDLGAFDQAIGVVAAKLGAGRADEDAAALFLEAVDQVLERRVEGVCADVVDGTLAGERRG